MPGEAVRPGKGERGEGLKDAWWFLPPRGSVIGRSERFAVAAAWTLMVGGVRGRREVVKGVRKGPDHILPELA